MNWTANYRSCAHASEYDSMPQFPGITSHSAWHIKQQTEILKIYLDCKVKPANQEKETIQKWARPPDGRQSDDDGRGWSVTVLGALAKLEAVLHEGVRGAGYWLHVRWRSPPLARFTLGDHRRIARSSEANAAGERHEHRRPLGIERGQRLRVRVRWQGKLEELAGITAKLSFSERKPVPPETRAHTKGKLALYMCSWG